MTHTSLSGRPDMRKMARDKDVIWAWRIGMRMVIVTGMSGA